MKKNNIILFKLFFLCIFCWLSNDIFAQENSDFQSLNLNMIESNETSPYSEEIFKNIESQIYNSDTDNQVVLRNNAINILNEDRKNLSSNFQGVVYSINHNFEIGVSFKDSNSSKYFNPTSKNIMVNFNNDNLQLETKFFNKNKGINRKIAFKYKKHKMRKAFFVLDETRSGLFVMLPDFGEGNIQGIVMCPRRLVNRGDGSYELTYNDWKLSSIFNRAFSKVSIVINELSPIDIQAHVLFNKSCNEKNIIDSAHGKMVSAKAIYEPQYNDEFRKILLDKIKFPLNFSIKSGVSYMKNSVYKEAFKRIVYEIREYKLPNDFKFSSKMFENTTVKNGICYTVIGVTH